MLLLLLLLMILLKIIKVNLVDCLRPFHSFSFISKNKKLTLAYSFHGCVRQSPVSHYMQSCRGPLHIPFWLSLSFVLIHGAPKHL
jgi:hypothetical protein